MLDQEPVEEFLRSRIAKISRTCRQQCTQIGILPPIYGTDGIGTYVAGFRQGQFEAKRCEIGDAAVR